MNYELKIMEGDVIMKSGKIISLLCAGGMLAYSLCGTAFAVTGGSGSGADPYKISTAADLFDISADPGASYVITNDIVLETALPEFDLSGTLDGNGHSINYDASSGKSLFSSVSGTVTDLNVRKEKSADNAILAKTVTGTIERCSVVGTVKSSEGAAGGIAGTLSGGKIINCYSDANVSGSAQSGGGIAGTAANASIASSYVSGKVSGSGSEVGAVVGKAENTSVTSCYYDKSNTSLEFGVYVGSDTTTGLDSDAMMSSASYQGFDFGSVWMIIDGSTTPMLIEHNGLGTADKPYRIHNADEFRALIAPNITDSSKYYELCGDITDDMTCLGDTTYQFKGHLDGKGYVIASPTVYSNGDYNAIFAVVGEGAEIKNVTRSIINSKSGAISGGIAAVNYGSISGCAVSGTISATKDAGGIVGENIGGTITDCKAVCNITARNTGAGGIAGFNSYGTIERCASNSTVKALSRTAGGIAGDNSYGTIKNCYALGRVDASSESGGIAGRLYNGSILQSYASLKLNGTVSVGGIYGAVIEDGYTEGSVYDIDTAANSYADEQQAASFGKTEQQMMSAAAYAGFDLLSVWAIDEGRNTPTLIAVDGSGTRSAPYKIRCDNDLSKIGSGRKLYYRLANNIYAKSGYVIEEFSGCLDGGGYTVYRDNMQFQKISDGAYVGNICVSGGGMLAVEINNATVEYCTIDRQHKNGGSGGFAETITNSTVRNCKAVNINISDSTAGGFAESISGGTIEDCYVVNSKVNGANIAGGFVGRSSGTRISGSGVYDTTVTSDNTVGGFVGRSDNGTSIADCYTTAEVSAGQYAGLFVGMNYADISGSCGGGKTQAEESTPAPDATAAPVVTLGFAGLDEGTSSNCTTSYSGKLYVPKVTLLPEGGITLPDIGTDAPVESAGGLTDISGHWAEATILKLVEAGVIDGYDDNTFRPQNGVTKAEFIKLMLAADGVKIQDGFTAYEDVNKHWAKNNIYTAITLGLCDNINESATAFGADSIIKRVEAAAMMGRLKGAGMSGTPSFPDTDSIPEWALNPVYACEALGLMNGMEDNSFAPENSLTRAEAATIVERIMNMK